MKKIYDADREKFVLQLKWLLQDKDSRNQLKDMIAREEDTERTLDAMIKQVNDKKAKE